MSAPARAPGLDLGEAIAAAIERLVLGRREDCYDVLKFADLLAAMDSAAYYQDRMWQAEAARDGRAVLDLAASRCRPDGLVLEFGVASGRTINHLAARLPDRVIYGFDSFAGLPETWRTGFPSGMFAQPPPLVAANVLLVEGLFAATLPGFLADHPGEVALLHIDCDLYGATAEVLTALAPRLVPGSVIVFDEYFNFPGWRQHEFKAFQEFIAAGGRRYQYVAFNPGHQQVCVVMAP